MVTYEVNEKKGTVVARYVGGAEEVQESLVNTLNKIIDYDAIAIANININISSLLKKYRNRFELIGKAKCHEDDTFDVEKGKQIALDRLSRKFAVLRKDIL